MARVVGALSLTTLGFMIYGLAVDSPFVWVYVPITVVLAAAVFVIHRSVEFSTANLWWLWAVAVGNLTGGIYLIDGQPLYVKHLFADVRFDKPFHTVATGIAGWIAYEIVGRWAEGRASRPAIASAAVFVAIGLGGLVEMVEYVGSLVIENANVGDYGDTMLDLVVNALGAIVAVVIADRRMFQATGRAS